MDDNRSDKKNKPDNNFEQLSIFDVLKMSNAAGADFSSEELEAAIGKLQEFLNSLFVVAQKSCLL